MSSSATTRLDLSIVLPALREEAALEQLLPALVNEASGLAVPHEIIVVDSQALLDRTAEVCRRHAVRHVHRRGGPSYGDAVRTGIGEARGRFVIFMDADGSHDPRFLPRLWSMRDRADVIIGSRYVPGGATENPAILILLSLAVNVFFRLVLGLRCRDVSNSFRLYRAEQLRQLKLQCTNFEIIEEMLIKLCSRPIYARILEIPVVFGRRKAGVSKRNLFGFALSYLFTLLKLVWFKLAIRFGRG